MRMVGKGRHRRVIATMPLVQLYRHGADSCDNYHKYLVCQLQPRAGVPIREFTDSKGVNWRVWPTLPDLKSAHPAALHDGWLTFECDKTKRRIVPIPDGWEYVPIDELEMLCNAAEEFRPTRRSNPNREQERPQRH